MSVLFSHVKCCAQPKPSSIKNIAYYFSRKSPTMDYIDTWRTLALTHGRWKNLDLARFQSKDGMRYWWFGTYQHGSLVDHIFFELWAPAEDLDWEIFGATFGTDSTGVHLGIEPCAIKPMHERTSRSCNLYFYMLSPGNWTKYNCSIQLKESDTQCSLISIDVSAYDGPSWPQTTKRRSPVWQVREEFNVENDVVSTELACPECYGVGTKREFSIPKADFANALNGYDRYSSNKICSVRACTSCGGKGLQHEKWYINENPDLPKPSRIFREGSGIVRTPRFPSKWQLG